MFNRLFLAIPVPKETSLTVRGLLEPLKDIEGLRLIPAENYHITVHFFGNVEETKVPQLIRGIACRLKGLPSFVLRAEKLALLNRKHGGMIWLIFSASEFFARLSMDVQKLEGGPAREQAAHITCARIKAGALKHSALPPLPEIRPFELTAAQVELLKSVDSREGVKYTSIAAFKLSS